MKSALIIASTSSIKILGADHILNPLSKILITSSQELACSICAQFFFKTRNAGAIKYQDPCLRSSGYNAEKLKKIKSHSLSRISLPKRVAYKESIGS